MDCADVCWTVSVVHNKEEKIQAFRIDKKIEKPLKWNIEWVNLDIRNKMLLWAAD